MFDDVPLFWDAWDVMEYHLETRSISHYMYYTSQVLLHTTSGYSSRKPLLVSNEGVSIEECGPLRASVQVLASSMT